MNRTIFASGLFLLVLISACAQNGGDASGSAPTTPFLGGSKGLEINFLEGEPPEEVTDGGTFPFQAIVSLKNEGEFDLKRKDVRVDLIGIFPADFGVSPDQLQDKIPEDDPTPRIRDAEGNIQEAVVTDITFPGIDDFFNFERSVTGNTVFVFRADACYKYQTRALSSLCVLRNLINVDDDSLCDPSESKTVFSSGAPIKVSNFKQTVGGQDKVTFSFDVTHSGDGDIFKEGDATSPPADCPRDPRERREKENKVKVTVDSGIPNLRCVGLSGTTSGFITMVDGRRTVTCTQELDPGRNDFQTNVDITLDYNYRDDAEQEVLVKHLIDS